MSPVCAAALLVSAAALGACSDDPKSASPETPDGGTTEDRSEADASADTSTNDASAPASPVFGADKLTFTAEVGTGPGVCFDFDSAAALDCEAGADSWDLMFEVDATNHAYNLWTNGGVKGSGKGASFGPISQAEADAILSSKDVPGWFPDYLGGIFADSPWYAYDVMGTHDVTANGRVYVVDTGTDSYRVQLTSYYGAGGTSGKVTLRYGKLSETTYEEVVLDATAGGFGTPAGSPADRAAYFDLDGKAVVAISDAEARASNQVWDIGIKRYNVTLNGGASGPGNVKGAIADAREDLYDASGEPIKAKFEAITAESMQSAFEAVVDAAGLTFKADRGNTYISNDGSDKSWFGVQPPPPTPPVFFARPENWWIVRSAGGDSYAKVHVTDVVSSSRSFTVELFVQPKPE